MQVKHIYTATLPGKTIAESIAYLARVSNPSNQHNDLTAPRLIVWLLEQPHWSPFEMCDMCLEIETSRAISTQILRHYSFKFQEFSQRYAEIQGFEPVELRLQGKTKQGSSIVVNDPYLTSVVDNSIEHTNKAYRTLIEYGIARECARFVLPMCVTTRMYIKGSIRSWIHYIQVRTHPDTQKEHRQIGELARLILIDQFPEIAPHLEPKIEKKCGNCVHSSNNYCMLYNFFGNDENHFCKSHEMKTHE